MDTSDFRLSAHPAVQSALNALPKGEALAPLLDNARCVSFDFFDTLFARPFAEPELAFDLLGRRLGIADFRQQRIAAQKEAFRRMALAGRKEIRLSDIYACFDAPAEQQALWAQLETELEFALLAPKPDVLALFHALREAGAQLAICSDMYFPQAFFTQALQQHGIEAVDLLLVSAEEDATKRDAGELFSALAEKSGHAAQHILHIGDHALADVQRAQARGLMAFHYHAPGLSTHERAARIATLHGLWERCRSATTNGLFERLGFLYGGAANLGYLQWLAEQCQNDGIEHLLFLSRDGYLLERLARKQPLEGLPAFHYFTGSRVAYYLAAMTEKNFSAYLPFLLSGSDGLKPRELLERIGVTPPAAHVMHDIGLGDEVSVTQELRETLASFLFAWRAEILRVCARNRRALRLYLAELGIQSGAKIGLVDVGWSGSTQEAFLAATRPWMDLDVTGYYLALADTEERKTRDSQQRMVAMFSSHHLGEQDMARLYNNRSIIELFFSAPHPTTIGWQIKPKTFAVESIMDAGRGGSPQELHAISQRIIDAAEHFTACYGEMSARLGADLSPRELAEPLLHLAAHDIEQCQTFASQVINFDTWSSSSNQRTDLMNYT